MIKNKRINFRLKATLILLMILLTSVYMNFPTDFSNDSAVSKKKNGDEVDEIFNPFKGPKISTFKFDQWWNISFDYRALINVTNPHDVNLTDTWASIQFNYDNLVSAGKMNASLKDVRIIEIDNGYPIEREYYIEKDSPGIGLATVWFRTTCENNTLEMDTYLYYGNNSVDYGSELVSYNPIGINWYRFEEGTGTTVSNELGQYDGTMVAMDNSNWESTTGSDEYQIGEYYLDFAGGGGAANNEYIFIQDQAFTGAVSIPNLTVSCWFKTSFSHSSDEFANWAFFDFDRSEYFNFFINAETGQIGFATSSTYRNMQDFWSNTPDLNDGDWHFAMAMFNTSHKVLYVDGVTVDAVEETPHDPGSGPLPLGTGTTRYGFMGDGSEASGEDGSRNNKYYEGGLDEVRYFNGSLDYNERLQVYKQYEPITALNEEHANTANINVTAVGLDGLHIPNVVITLNENADGSSYVKRQTTGDDGSTLFTGLGITPVFYNFTANMTSSIDPNLKVRVNISAPIRFNKFFTELNITCNVSTVVFDVIDADQEPVESGWVLVGNETGRTQIQNCPIDSTGKARFWWLNDTSYKYNYTVKYYNSDYNPSTITLATGQIADLKTQDLISVQTNLTTIIFQVYSTTPPDYEKLGGAGLSIKENKTGGIDIVTLTTHPIDGNITYRWINSSQIGDASNRQVTLTVSFGGDKQFNMTDVILAPDLKYEATFTINKRKTYEIYVLANPDDYTTVLVSLNPTENFNVEWGTQLTIRYFFNSTEVSDPILEEEKLGPIDTNSMTYKVMDVAKIITYLSGTMHNEVESSGIHQGTIDTSMLEVKTYTVEIMATEAGYVPPDPEYLELVVSKNGAIVNESNNDDSLKSNYWLGDINMTVQPYGENAEFLNLENEIFTKNSTDYMTHEFKFSIPDISTDWNLSKIIFDISDITWDPNTNSNEYNFTFSDPVIGYNTVHDSNATTSYGVTKKDSGSPGEWLGITFEYNKGSPTNNNIFVFTIGGSFIDCDINARTYFLRDKINTQYSLFNVTDSISIYSDGNGWAIKNVTFKLFNCRDPTDWSSAASSLTNIVTNDGYNYTITYIDTETAILTIDNITIYPYGNEFLFNVINTNIMFDVNVTIEFIQGLYWNQNLENVSGIITEQDFSGGFFTVSITDEPQDLGTFLLVSDLGNSIGESFSPTQIGMSLTINGIPGSISVGENGFVDLNSIAGIQRNQFYDAFLEMTEGANFTLFFTSENIRNTYYKISGSVSFEVTPTYKDSVPYDDTLETYLLTIDTSLLNAQLYTVVFTFTSDYYETSFKNLNMEVLERETLINNRPGAYQLITDIDVQTEIIFSFTYVDEETDTILYDLNVQRYEWEYYGEGSTLLALGEGELSVDTENILYLDFNTKLRAVGRYQLIATLSKQNYETKIGIISLLIEERDIDYNLGDMFEDKQVSVVKGKTIILEIELEDDLTGDPLTGADVVLEIGDKEFEFDEEDDGVYELEFDTKKYEAFFTSNIITGTIKVSKANYTKEEIDITIVVEMEEITEGVPTFYFLMVASAIAAIVGSLATYRYIQIARIPTFVKKARKVKKSIKSGNKISEALMYPSKDEFMVKTLDAKYKALGLSLDDLLGLKGKGKTEDSLKKNGGVK